jgi:hypothetical protein
MKTTSRRIYGALLGLCVLFVIVRRVRADETADWMAEMRRQNDEFNRQAQEDRDARDKFNREAQEERAARDKWNREAQDAGDERSNGVDDWRNRLTGDGPAAGQARQGRRRGQSPRQSTGSDSARPLVGLRTGGPAACRAAESSRVSAMVRQNQARR